MNIESFWRVDIKGAKERAQLIKKWVVAALFGRQPTQGNSPPVAQAFDIGGEIEIQVIGQMNAGDIFVVHDRPVALVVEGADGLSLRKLGDVHDGEVMTVLR